MTPEAFNRLHDLRQENDAARYAQQELAPRFEALATRHEDGTAPRAVSAFQLFQTPPALAARLVALADIQPGERVLDPSAGLGRLLVEAEHARPADITAVEICPDLTAELYRQDRPNLRIMQRDFLTCTPEDFGLGFDRVVMNPPFHMRADIRHTLHALQFLRPGGRLAGLCLDTHHRATALRHLVDTWEEIPAGAFKSEGTHVATILFSITK